MGLSKENSKQDLKKDTVEEFLLSMEVAVPDSTNKAYLMENGLLTNQLENSHTPKDSTKAQHVRRTWRSKHSTRESQNLLDICSSSRYRLLDYMHSKSLIYIYRLLSIFDTDF